MDPLKPFGIKLFCPIGILEFSLLWMLGRNPKEGRWARRLVVEETRQPSAHFLPTDGFDEI